MLSFLFLFCFFLYGNIDAQDYDVIIMGAGMTGIRAGLELYRMGIDNFLILEAQSYIGGRVNTIDFGGGTGINTGGSWISGACENFNDGSSCWYMGNNPGNNKNPMLSLAEQYNVPWARTDIHEWRLPYPPYLNGAGGETIPPILVSTEYVRWLDEVQPCLEEKITCIWRGWCDDESYMAALRECGWLGQITLSQVIQWIEFNLEYAYNISEYSVYMSDLGTYVNYGNQDLLTLDAGYQGIVLGLASEYIDLNDLNNDAHILLNAPIGNIEYNVNDGVTVSISGTPLTFTARYGLVTFGIGVLKNRNADIVTFAPPLPQWKQNAIDTTEVADYSPLYIKWANNWWAAAGHPEIDTGSKDGIVVMMDERYGYFTWFINYNHENIRPGSLIWRFDITEEIAIQFQNENNDEIITALKNKLSRYFAVNDIPDPESVYVSGWTNNPFVQGAYGAYPIGYDWDAMLVDLQYAADQVLYFGGEHTSYDYAGYVHGAYFEGIRGAQFIGNCLGINTGQRCQGPYTMNAREKQVMYLRKNSTKHQHSKYTRNKKPKWAL